MTSDADTALYKSFIHPYTRKQTIENSLSHLQMLTGVASDQSVTHQIWINILLKMLLQEQT